MSTLTNQEKRLAAEEAQRARKIDVIFRQRHSKGDASHHTRWVHRDPIGDYRRVECAACDVIVNITSADLDAVRLP